MQSHLWIRWIELFVAHIQHFFSESKTSFSYAIECIDIDIDIASQYSHFVIQTKCFEIRKILLRLQL